jgi:hypothetical protein
MNTPVKLCITLVMMLVFGCAGTTGGPKVLEERVGNNVLVIGNVVVENINQGFEFDNWERGAELVIIGRSDDGAIITYTTKTDSKGYFLLANVPPVQYAVKSITLAVFGGQPIKLVNDYEQAQSKFYRMRFPLEEVENSAEFIPATDRGKVIDLGILWLGLRKALIADMSSKTIGEIMMLNTTDGADLEGKRFWEMGYVYDREDPSTYFKEKYPESGWWK